MVICKFFLQGTCRFGDNCKFEHQINRDHNYSNSSILVQNYGSKPQTTTNVDTNALVKAVVNDMTTAEKGGQWLLSSYAPFKEKPAFPGFEDHSMEEVRYLFYESVKNGTVEQYKQNLQMMLQQAMMKIKALQNPSPEAINMLKNIYDTPPSSSFNNNQTSFNATPSSSVFGGTQPQQSVFGNPPPNQNIFATGTTPQQSVFSGSNTNSIFGGQSPNNSVFGTPAPNQNKSIFGGGQPTGTSNNSIFGGGSASNSIFGQSQQTVFNQQQNSPFAQTNQSVFAQNTGTQQNIFQQTLTNGPFGNTPNGPTIMGGVGATTHFLPPSNVPGVMQKPITLGTCSQIILPTTQTTPFQHTQNIFGNVLMQQARGFDNTPVQSKPNEEFYSKIEDLTEEEIKWFQSDDLDIMKIPEKPPPYEMCFKVQ